MMRFRVSTADRPRLDLEPSSFERIVGLFAWLGVGAAFATLVYFWPVLPPVVPRHFDATGQVDGWGPRSMTALVPVIALVLVGGLSALGRYPHRFNYPVEITEENAAIHYRAAVDMVAAIKAAIALLFAAITWQICVIATGGTVNLAPYVLPVAALATLAPIVWYFVRVRRAR